MNNGILATAGVGIVGSGYAVASYLGQGMASWTPEQWGVFFIAAGSFVSVSLIPLVVAYWKGKNTEGRVANVEGKVTDVEGNQKSMAKVISDNVPSTPEDVAKVDEIAAKP